MVLATLLLDDDVLFVTFPASSMPPSVEARGFIFGPPIALAIGAKFVPLRKPRKLPGEVISESYTLEYGTDRLEMHVGAVQPGESVLIVDDLVATGGTLSAAIRLLERVGAEVVECACVIGLPLVKGNWRLNGVPLYALVEPRLSDEIRITPNSDLIKDRPTFVSTDWRHPWDPTLRTLPKSRMTKQGNVTQRTPQAKKQSDQASRQISKQASGSANAPYDLVFTAMGPPLGTTQTTATITSAEGLQRATFTTPPQTVPGTNTTEPPPLPLRNKGPELGADNLTLEGVATELAPSDFNLKTTRLWSPSCKRKQKRDQASLQDDFNCRVRDRLGSRDVHSRLGQRHSPNESPPSSDSRDIGASAAEELARPQKDSLGQRGDPDDHLKIFESAATIENWPQPVWCHMFNSTLVGNARNWFSKLPRRSIDGFEELRRAFRLNFTQRKKCAKNPVELARVKQRQGESTSAYVERYKDECIHVKACPEILKISGFMNGINNPELIKRLNDRVPQTFDELMKRTRNIPGDNPKNRVAVATTLPRARGGRGNHKYNPTDNEPKEIHATEGANIPKATTKATPRRATAWGTDTVKKKERQLDTGEKHIEVYTRPTTSLTGFTVEKIWAYGQLRLPVMVGNKEHSTTVWMNFMVIRSPSPYNGIIGRPGISAIRAVPSTAHGMLKFPVDGGIVTIYNTAAPPKECNTVTCDVTQTQRQHATKVTNLKVAIHPDYPEQEVSIGGSLSDTGRAAVCALLQRNLDIFAWEPKHMTGVPRSITEHKLKIRQGYSPVRQKKRGQAPERAKAILEEVHKLVEAGIMREVYYHDWLSNPVMVKKSDGSWRMCVDFTDLNKACPQDCYPLPEIDWKVESLCGYPFKCFLDAYKGYHQIQMAKDDEEKTAFHTSQGVYCYTKMPFGLKNAGATYQRLVDNAFEGQVGRNLEVYVDDLVIKSHTEDELVRDIVETFRALRKINMKLNPKKCTFGATEGMFLGYLIEPDGIKPCPEKTKAVIQLPSPRTMKEVQSLNGKLAGLNRFLSKSADKSLPLFKTLKKCTKKGDFRWTTEAEEAFTQLKQHIAALPTLVAPRPGEELIMYLSATHGAISAVLLTDRDSVQTPVYFVSKALKETEINYSAMEKLILALVFAAKRLRRYFQAHPIVVITDQPIKQVISKPDASGRLQKWSVLLGEHNISYRPRTAVKGQILADFLIEKPETDYLLSCRRIIVGDNPTVSLTVLCFLSAQVSYIKT
ncbi:reverse transcriptase domain-containing protein [Tanacetum coccineum]